MDKFEQEKLMQTLREAVPQMALTDERNVLIGREASRLLGNLRIQGHGVSGQGKAISVQRDLRERGGGTLPGSDTHGDPQSGGGGEDPATPYFPEPVEDLSCCCGDGALFSMENRIVELVVSGVSVNCSSCVRESQAALYDDEYTLMASVNGAFSIYLGTSQLNCDIQCELIGESESVGTVTHRRRVAATPGDPTPPLCEGDVMEGPHYLPVVWRVISHMHDFSDEWNYDFLTYFYVELMLPMLVNGLYAPITPYARWHFNCDGSFSHFEMQHGEAEEEECFVIPNPSTAITIIPPV